MSYVMRIEPTRQLSQRIEGGQLVEVFSATVPVVMLGTSGRASTKAAGDLVWMECQSVDQSRRIVWHCRKNDSTESLFNWTEPYGFTLTRGRLNRFALTWFDDSWLHFQEIDVTKQQPGCEVALPTNWFARQGIHPVDKFRFAFKDVRQDWAGWRISCTASYDDRQVTVRRFGPWQWTPVRYDAINEN